MDGYGKRYDFFKGDKKQASFMQTATSMRSKRLTGTDYARILGATTPSTATKQLPPTKKSQLQKQTQDSKANPMTKSSQPSKKKKSSNSKRKIGFPSANLPLTAEIKCL